MEAECPGLLGILFRELLGAVEAECLGPLTLSVMGKLLHKLLVGVETNGPGLLALWVYSGNFFTGLYRSGSSTSHWLLTLMSGLKILLEVEAGRL